MPTFSPTPQSLVRPSQSPTVAAPAAAIHVAVLTAGRDKPYALGLGEALKEQGIVQDFIGSDDVDAPGLHGTPLVNFLNLRGDQSAAAGPVKKLIRVLVYYGRLLVYAATARPKVFHILWHNKFDFLDRTLLMGFYKLCGRRLVFTAHNVNAGERDGNDSWLNRLGLYSQYHLADHLFVHTEEMKRQLQTGFGVRASRVTVIPFGINNTLPNTSLVRADARQRLGLNGAEKVVLFFGNITAYKGLEVLVEAMIDLLAKDRQYRLVIAGRPKGAEAYWQTIRQAIVRAGIEDRVLCHIDFIPDEQVEVYFKAADLLVLPYRHIFQSGVLFLGYSFGLPVLASDVGSLRDGISAGRTGYVCRPDDPVDLAAQIQRYFSSELYLELESRRRDIMAFANERYSWTKVGEITRQVYERLLKPRSP